MKTYSSVATIKTTQDADNVFDLAWDGSKDVEFYWSMLWDSFVTAGQESTKPMQFADWMMAHAIARFNGDRKAAVDTYYEYHGELPNQLTDMPENKGIQSAWTSARQACATHASGVTFNTGGKLNATKIWQGETLKGEIDTSRHGDDKKKADTTADGKNSPSAQVMTEVGGESGKGSQTGKQIAGEIIDAALARSVILNLMNQYPELTMDKGVKDNYKRNFEKACKVAASKKALLKKAA